MKNTCVAASRTSKKLNQEGDEHQHRQHVVDEIAGTGSGRFEDFEKQHDKCDDDEKIAERHAPDGARDHRQYDDIMLQCRNAAIAHQAQHRKIVKNKRDNH